MALPDPTRAQLTPTTSRKADHIRINLEEDVNSKGLTSGFEQYRFGVETMEEHSIRVLTTTDLPRVADAARRELIRE